MNLLKNLHFLGNSGIFNKGEKFMGRYCGIGVGLEEDFLMASDSVLFVHCAASCSSRIFALRHSVFILRPEIGFWAL